MPKLNSPKRKIWVIRQNYPLYGTMEKLVLYYKIIIIIIILPADMNKLCSGKKQNHEKVMYDFFATDLHTTDLSTAMSH